MSETATTATARPFHVQLFSSIFEEFKDLFLHATNQEEASRKALACLADEEAEMECGKWEILKVQSTENVAVNTATNKGIYLGEIKPFPTASFTMFAFATNKSGSNKSFLPSLDGVVEISASELAEKMETETQAKASFFSTFPSFTRD